ncbi:MAG: nitrite/sulfite reductase [bacterium]
MSAIATPPNAVDDLRNAIAEYRAGTIDLDTFRKRRSAFGIYGLRGDPERVMVRVKIPLGRLSADQMTRVAELTAKFTQGRCHITTRQDLQLHGVPLDAAPDVLGLLTDAAMTSCGSCGNRVRNVTACPLAGICPTELFDVSEYATAVAEYFHDNPVGTNLPRKIKIAFAGCADDCVMTATNDIGVLPARVDRDGRAHFGFRILAGGGLGATPRAGQLLEPFTPVNLLAPTIEAVLRVFNAHGDRTPRSKARLKFLIERMGFDTFRKLVQEERDELSKASSRFPHVAEPVGAGDPPPALPLPAVAGDADFGGWMETNVRPHRRGSGVAVMVRVPLGDLTAHQCEGLAAIARVHADGRLVMSPSQNVVVPCVDRDRLATVYRELQHLDLALGNAERIQDVTSCPGTETCQIGITASKQLARALAEVLDRPEYRVDTISSLRIRVSGCPNSCSGHRVADIGFHGVSKPAHGRAVPHYEMSVGGGAEDGRAWFAQPVTRIPARRIPAALEKLLNVYSALRLAEESFGDFTQRLGLPALQQLMQEFVPVGPPDQEPALYCDWGDDLAFDAKRSARKGHP